MERKNKVNVISVDVNEFNKILKYVRSFSIIREEPGILSKVSTLSFLWQDKRSNYHLLYKDFKLKKVKHIYMDPYTGEAENNVVNRPGFKAYMKMKEFCKKYDEDINYKNNEEYSTKFKWEPFEFMDSANAEKWIPHCYEYDSNSNYLSKFKMPLPYGDIIRENDYVHKGEIGFNFSYNSRKESIISGVLYGKADIIFKTKIYKGLCDFADYMYEQRKNLPEGSERDQFKTIICSAHGNLKHHNIFMAAAIIAYSKQEIKHYSEKVHVYMNTVDSIVCDKPIQNIPLGMELGQFKLKHTDESFYYKSHGIKMWESGEVSWKGTKKSRIGIEFPKYYISDKGEIYEIN